MSTCSLAFFLLACGRGGERQTLEGRWVGNYAMMPAVFEFHGDTVAVSLAGKFDRQHFEHADTGGAIIVHVPRPNAWFKFVFVRMDSAVVVINWKERISVVRDP